LSCNEGVEVGDREHLALAFAAVAGREVMQRACLDVTFERFLRAAELRRRLRHGQRVIGPAHAPFARSPLNSPPLLDPEPKIIGPKLVVDDVLLRQLAHGATSDCGFVIWPAVRSGGSGRSILQQAGR
jgi:hypothetical protein